ncbi:MAG: hypothetical protein JXR05_00325 [Flavobacteriaceae bacterium]
MQEIQSILKNILLPTIQFLAVLIGLLYFSKLKKSYWKWFLIYLIIIFIQEYFWMKNTSLSREHKIGYYVFFGIPFQYLFLYWLYALKSFKSKKLFLTSSLIYIGTIIIVAFFKELDEILSLSTNIGTFILTGLIILEFIKQIKNDDILKFRENKMFYINIGLVLFYIGNYPYHVFGKELYQSHKDIWDLYQVYFLASNNIMYLLFAASFKWGKTQS